MENFAEGLLAPESIEVNRNDFDARDRAIAFTIREDIPQGRTLWTLEQEEAAIASQNVLLGKLWELDVWVNLLLVNVLVLVRVIQDMPIAFFRVDIQDVSSSEVDKVEQATHAGRARKNPAESVHRVILHGFFQALVIETLRPIRQKQPMKQHPKALPIGCDNHTGHSPASFLTCSAMGR